MAALLTRALLVALAGCSPATDASTPQQPRRPQPVAERTTDRATLGRGEATLVSRAGTCLLRRIGHPDLALAPKPPCRFLRADGEVQRQAYPARGIDAVVLVVGTPADPARRAKFGLAATVDCGTVAHGLIVRGDTVTAARRPMADGMFCADRGRDEKDFYAVAHDR